VVVLALLVIVVILVPTSATAHSAFPSDYQVISYLVAFDGPVFALLISVARFVPEAALLCWINTQR
jgi:hypothetical protein